MPDSLAYTALVLTSAGAPAFETLTSGHKGRVVALFDHCIYAEFDGSWVCLGTESLPMGPLNIRSTAPAGLQWSTFRLRIDDPVCVRNGRLQVGHALKMGIGDVAIWRPAPPPHWTVETAREGLKALDCLLGPGSFEGLSGFALAVDKKQPRSLSGLTYPPAPRSRRAGLKPAPTGPNPSVGAGRRPDRDDRQYHTRQWSNDPVMDAARQPVGKLRLAARRAFRDLPVSSSEIDNATVALLGLGPGLTPSGDDLLGGMLIALHILPAPAMRAALRDAVERHAPSRTNAISLAHLRAAGDGAGHEAVHLMLNCLLRGDEAVLPDCLSAIDKIGHSSGRDTLAGLCVVLRAYTEVLEHPRSVTA